MRRCAIDAGGRGWRGLHACDPIAGSEKGGGSAAFACACAFGGADALSELDAGGGFEGGLGGF